MLFKTTAGIILLGIPIPSDPPPQNASESITMGSNVGVVDMVSQNVEMTLSKYGQKCGELKLYFSQIFPRPLGNKKRKKCAKVKVKVTLYDANTVHAFTTGNPCGGKFT